MAGPGILQLSRMGVVLIIGASSQLSTMSKLRELSSRENLCYRASWRHTIMIKVSVWFYFFKRLNKSFLRYLLRKKDFFAY